MNDGFRGFPRQTTRFLADLRANNRKDWFDAHRDDYEQLYVAPARAFVEAMGPRLRKISPAVHFEPKVNGSLFRIQRDIRFSRDKTPYKDHLDLWFWEGAHRGWDAPGFYLRLTPERLMIGAGMHHFEKPVLEAFRAAVLDDRKGKALEATLATLRKAGPYALRGATRKTVPRGMDAGHARAHLLLHEGLAAGLEVAVPGEARSEKLVGWCEAHFRRLSPLNRWLREIVPRG